MFDVEWPKQHPNLPEAMRLAKENGIRLAISNPCFELWLILHFEDQTAFITTADAERRSRQFDGRAGKRIDADRYMPVRKAAVKRALQLSARHGKDETSCPHDNPSSSMYDLIATIEPE